MSAEITKLEKKLSDGEASELRGLPVSEHREAIVTTRNNDEQLKDTKELLKELNAPYREQLSANKVKARFIALLLEERKDA